MSVQVRDGNVIGTNFRTSASRVAALRFYRSLRDAFDRRDANLITLGWAMARNSVDVVADETDQT